MAAQIGVGDIDTEMIDIREKISDVKKYLNKTMYKQDYSKCKIEIRYEDLNGEYRYIYWRISPSDMTWWDRTFRNPWRIFKHECVGRLNPCYGPKRYKNDLSHIKTYEDALRYYNQQKNIADSEYQRLVDTGDTWPKKLNNN